MEEMNALLADDEELILAYTVKMCKEIPGLTNVWGFTSAKKALAWFRDHTVDIAFLDIDMPDMNGLELAARIKETSPDTAILFLTGHDRYAVSAFEMHATGYLMKPVTTERLEEEVNYVFSGMHRENKSPIRVQTFGHFDVFVDGRLVSFGRSRAKELLALLVDRQGEPLTRKEAFELMWEGEVYDRPMQKQFDVAIRSLRSTLEEYGADRIIDLARGGMRILPGTFDCDLYRFLEGDVEAVNSYRGEYMGEYAWAVMTEGLMTGKMTRLS